MLPLTLYHGEYDVTYVLLSKAGASVSHCPSKSQHSKIGAREEWYWMDPYSPLKVDNVLNMSADAIFSKSTLVERRHSRVTRFGLAFGVLPSGTGPTPVESITERHFT